MNARPKALPKFPIKAAIATLRQELEDKLAIDLLQRLEEHPDTERTVREILDQTEKGRGRLRDYLLRDSLLEMTIWIVRVIVKTKIGADVFNEAMVQVIAAVQEQNQEAKRAFAARQKSIARHVLGMSSPKKLVLYMELTAAEMRQEERSNGFDSFRSFFELLPPGMDRFRIPRSDKRGSRARSFFIREASILVRSLTGKWLDAEVATLTEIVFDVEAVSAEAVRAARKGRSRRSAHT
jgi:hypothetical protein